ncbi:uncharacterized protein ACN427_008962 isoform 1-T1 [Glossina fuscipes fuscipes]
MGRTFESENDLFFTAVLIVNCLVTLINGRTIQKSLTQPYNKLLPPPVPEIATATTIRTATATTTPKATIFTTEKIPKIGIEALLPPKIQLPSPSQSPTTPLVGQAYKQIAANINTTTTRTTTRTARLKTTTTTAEPVTISTIVKPKSSIPLPALDVLLPPLLEDDAKGIENNKKNRFKETQGLASKPKIIHDGIATPSLEILLPPLIASETIRFATVTDSDLSKATKKPTHNYTALSRHLNESQKQQSQNIQHTRPVVVVVNPITKQYKNKPEKQEFSITTQRHVAREPVSRTTFKPNVNILNDEQHVAKHHFSKYDYSYGLTTIRPIKNGLPTITPFPHTVKRKK